MTETTTTRPTILDRGGMYSRAMLDHRAHALTQVKEQFEIPKQTNDVLGNLLARLRFLRSQVFAHLDSGRTRQELHREQFTKISRQLENGTDRYDDLPPPSFPHEFLGPTKDVDGMRQKIFDERARLQEEVRRLDHRFWSDLQEVRGQVAEVLAEYVELAGRVETLTQSTIPVPALTDLFGFLEAPEPEEVLVPTAPEVLDSSSLVESLP